MTVTETTCAQVIKLLREAGITGLGEARPATWAAVLNAAPRTVQDGDRRVPMRDERGVPVPLNIRDEEVMPAAVQIATLGGRFVQAADIAAAVTERREGDAATRSARIQADAQAHGPLIPSGLGGDVAAELAWRRAASAAVASGASRQQAEAHAWRVIGRAPAQVTAGGPSGRDAARAAIKALTRKHTINHR